MRFIGLVTSIRQRLLLTKDIIQEKFSKLKARHEFSDLKDPLNDDQREKKKIEKKDPF